LLRYLLGRIACSAAAVWLVATLTFLLLHAVPGDPFSTEKGVPQVVLRNLAARYGLDRPLWEQYCRYLGGMLRGDLGLSMRYPNRTVAGVIAQGFPCSAAVGLLALSFGFPAGCLLGVASALRRGRVSDRLLVGAALVGVSVPGFVAASFLQYLFGVRWGLLPVAGWGTLRHLVLPSLSLGLWVAAVSARLVRAGMVDVLGEQYVLYARAKGMPGRVVVFRHAFRNAVLPLASALGPVAAHVVAGTFAVEQVFGMPGLGKHFVQAACNLDYTLVMGLAVFYAALLSAAVLAGDVLCAALDPRIRLGG